MNVVSFNKSWAADNSRLSFWQEDGVKNSSISLTQFEVFGPLFMQQRGVFNLAQIHFLILLGYELAFSPSISMMCKAEGQEER